MLSFPRPAAVQDNRQLYLVPDIASFILVYQRDNHILFLRKSTPPSKDEGELCIFIISEHYRLCVNVLQRFC